MTSPLDHVRMLSEKIGPRGSGSSQEKQAAAYIRQQFTTMGYKVENESFPTAATFSYAQSLFLIGIILGWLFSGRLPAFAAALSLVFLLLFLLDVETVLSVGQLFARRQSQNIRAYQSAAEAAAPKIIVMAHYDSSRAGINFHPQLVPGFRRSFILLVVSLTAVTLLNLARLFSNSPNSLFWAAVPFIGYLTVVLAGLVHRELWGKLTPGANDNASGVAVLLETARRLAEEKWAKDINCEFLATGAEEAGTFGILHYIHRHGWQDAIFINLDNLGQGRLLATSCEGLIRPLKVDPTLTAAAARAAAKSDVTLDIRPYRLLTTDATPVLARGGRAISIMAVDANGLLPNWHWPTDRLENVAPQNLQAASELAVNLIRLLSQRDLGGE